MPEPARPRLTSLACALLAASGGLTGQAPPAATEKPEPVPAALRPWLGEQVWTRDSVGPVLRLGAEGAFDDTHLFAPAIARIDGKYFLWYCGSSGTAYDLAPKREPDLRHFRLGLATSPDGKVFTRHPAAPVLGLPRRSILTPSILRDGDGVPIRVDGKLQLWFSSAAHQGPDRVHAIQAATSADGVEWSEPSPRLISNAYAPSVVRSGGGYEMWYTRPGRYPWVMMHARSRDGREWQVTEKPVLEISQPWEHLLQIYPHVVKVDGVYLMWYASYATADRLTTAVGFAASVDGVKWFKHPRNPVLRPDPQRPFESHYVSSQSVLREADGAFRIYYASRKAPPFRNLYFALNTARWPGPAARQPGAESRR